LALGFANPTFFSQISSVELTALDFGLGMKAEQSANQFPNIFLTAIG
jgi:hypothetical protein